MPLSISALNQACTSIREQENLALMKATKAALSLSPQDMLIGIQELRVAQIKLQIEWQNLQTQIRATFANSTIPEFQCGLSFNSAEVIRIPTVTIVGDPSNNPQGWTTINQGGWMPVVSADQLLPTNFQPVFTPLGSPTAPSPDANLPKSGLSVAPSQLFGPPPAITGFKFDPKAKPIDVSKLPSVPYTTPSPPLINQPSGSGTGTSTTGTGSNTGAGSGGETMSGSGDEGPVENPDLPTDQ